MCCVAFAGAKVSNTIREQIVNITIYNDEQDVLAAGYTASLLGCAVLLLLATFFGMPVSGTHGIVGATVGYTLVARGFEGIQWLQLVLIGAPAPTAFMHCTGQIRLGSYTVNSAYRSAHRFGSVLI